MPFQGPRVTASAAVAAALALALGLSLAAQTPPAIKRTVASKTDLAGCTDRESVMVWVDLPVGAAEGRHTHNAQVFAFVVEGTITLENEGAEKVTLKAGETFTYTPGKWHEAVNVGTTPVKLAAVFVAEKGKPLTVPVK
jgi:quercetin dioxygenase-like cupin family protein